MNLSENPLPRIRHSVLSVRPRDRKYGPPISQQRSLESKKFKKGGAFIFEFWLWEDPPHPVNWSPTHLTGPQTLFFTDIFQKCIYLKCIFAK